jgi:hypothetical protein
MAAYTLVITAEKLQVLGESGTYTELSLPSGVTFTGRPAKVARLKNRLVITSAVTVPIWVGADLIPRILALPTPGNAPTLSDGGAGSYSGTRKAKVSFIVRATDGTVVAESPLSSPSAAVTFASDIITVDDIAVPPSNSPVTDRRLYFTADSGETYFHAFDIEGTTDTSVDTTISDAALSLTEASDELVQAPVDLDLPTVWKNRVWGKSGDSVVGTAAGFIDRWPNGFPVDEGTDSFGITGFVPRKDEMAIGRRNRVYRLIGDDEDSFALPNLTEGIGILAPASCLVIKDIGYWLANDGVYVWDAQGVRSITDDTVRPWFNSDTYFNRSVFANAFACFDPIRNRYVLFLAPTGSTETTSWIEFDISSGKWFGPHTTDMDVSFTTAFVAPDANNVLRMIAAGDDGYLYALTPDMYTDGAADDEIALRILGKFHYGDDPDDTHVFLQPTVFMKPESGKTLTVKGHVGNTTSQTANYTQSADLGKDRHKLPRLGVGRICQIEFTQDAGGAESAILGYLIPYNNLGRR